MVSFVGRSAQTSFENYRCADGTQFVVGFFQYDSRAHLQLDGKAVTLAEAAGAVGVALFRRRRDAEDHQSRPTTLKHAKRPVTTCELDMKKGRNDFVPTLFYFADRA